MQSDDRFALLINQRILTFYEKTSDKRPFLAT